MNKLIVKHRQFRRVIKCKENYARIERRIKSHKIKPRLRRLLNDLHYSQYFNTHNNG